MKINKNTVLSAGLSLLLFSCQAMQSDATQAKASAEAANGKSRHELIKEEKRKQSEADLPFRGLDTTRKISTIAFSSSADQAQPQPIWSTIAKQNPDLFVFLSDPIYVSKPDQKNIAEQYRRLNRIPEYRDVREKVPFLSVWESEDDVIGEDGVSFIDKEASRAEFIKYWSYLKTAIPKNQKALYHSKIIGSKKQTVQVLLLDTRWDRSPLKKNTADEKKPLDPAQASGMSAASTDATSAIDPGGAPTPGTNELRPYSTDDDPKKHILSEEQWRWLEGELRKPAGLRLLVSSSQVIANDHGFEKWGIFPRERQRLLDLIKSTKANNLIILSGNRQLGAIAQTQLKDLGKITEITAGPINLPTLSRNSLKDSTYVKDATTDPNFGLLKVNWENRKATIELRGVDNAVISSTEVKF